MWSVVRRTLILSLLLAIVALLAGWWSYRLTLQNAIDRLAGEATLLAEHTGRNLEGIDAALSALVMRIEEEWRAGNPPDARFHDVLREQVGLLPQVTGMQILDAERRLIADQLSQNRNGLTLEARTYFHVFEDGRDPRALYFGDPVRGQITGKAFSTASYAILTPQGDFGGVVAATFDPFYYRRAYRKLYQPLRPHDVALVDERGTIIASSSDFATSIGVPRKTTSGESGFQPAVAPGGFLRLTVPTSGTEYIAYLIRVPTFPLYAFVGLREPVALANWRRLAIGLGLAWLIGTCGGAAAFISIWRRDQQREAAFAALEQANEETRDALNRAQAASAAKSRFLAHVSHELRTPLNAILGFSEVIRDRLIDGDPNRNSEYADLIHKSGSHLLQIINDLLDLSKIEAGKMPLHRQHLDVPELLENAAYLASRDIADHEVQIVTTVEDDCPPVYADQRAAKQMLVNLLSNAAKFSPPGAEVHLHAAADPDGGVAITVQDFGRGISSEKLQRLYEPFGGDGGEIANRGQGAGLGLPLVKSLVERHGGSIDVRSREAVGTTVTLRLPRAPSDSESGRVPESLKVAGGTAS